MCASRQARRKDARRLAPRRTRRGESLSLLYTATDANGGKRLDTWDLNSLEVEPHFPQVLRSDDEGRTIVINLPAGEELQEHQVHERSWIVVVDGEIEVEAAGDTVKGGPGFLIHAEPNERNEVRAVSDARLVMVLLPWPGAGHPSQRPARAEASD